MGWVTISLRKMALKTRISNMEYRLIQLSQEQQSLHSSSSYAQRSISMMQNQELSSFNATRMNNLKSIRSEEIDTKDYTAQSNRQQAIDEVNLGFEFAKMQAESVWQAEQDASLSVINQKQQQLELEQEQIQAQLSAARAEEQNLGEAMSKDIENGAIKLV